VDGNSSEQRPQAFDQRRAKGGTARRRRMGTRTTRTTRRRWRRWRRERADDQGGEVEEKQ
jgi:hypothetical protein